MKTVRIFLLVLIVIGLGLIVTEKLWVPSLVGVIVKSQTPSTPEQKRCDDIAVQALVESKKELAFKPAYGYEISMVGHYSEKFKSCMLEQIYKQPNFVLTTIYDQDNQKEILYCSVDSGINPSLGAITVCTDHTKPMADGSIDPRQIPSFEQEYMQN